MTEARQDAWVIEAPLVPAVRRLLLVAAGLVFLAGLQLFLFPFDTATWFAWTIGSPMTAVFLGASYWSAVALEWRAARSPTWSGARIALPAVFAFTAITFLVTLGHLASFHLGPEHRWPTRAITWGWLAVYAVVPLLMVLAHGRQRMRSTAVAPPGGLPSAVRVVLVVLAVVLLGLGGALLVAPTWADAAWPWALTSLTGRAIGAWLVGLGVAAGHARLLDDVEAVQPLAVTGVLFAAFQGVALARHGDELAWGEPSAWAYVAVVATMGVVGARVWSLERRARRP